MGRAVDGYLATLRGAEQENTRRVCGRARVLSGATSSSCAPREDGTRCPALDAASWSVWRSLVQLCSAKRAIGVCPREIANRQRAPACVPVWPPCGYIPVTPIIMASSPRCALPPLNRQCWHPSIEVAAVGSRVHVNWHDRLNRGGWVHGCWSWSFEHCARTIAMTSGLGDLSVQLQTVPDTDVEELAQLTDRLRAELLDLDVYAVQQPVHGEAPEDSKGPGLLGGRRAGGATGGQR
jgi:hypothetical protein